MPEVRGGEVLTESGGGQGQPFGHDSLHNSLPILDFELLGLDLEVQGGHDLLNLLRVAGNEKDWY